jgi:peptidoglycan/LPS O-acetylase OafA/YrhL
MGLLGVVSYPIYVLHVPVQSLLLTVTDAIGVDVRASFGLAGVLLAGLLVAGSLWVAKAYDEPARRWLTRRGAPGETRSGVGIRPMAGDRLVG